MSFFEGMATLASRINKVTDEDLEKEGIDGQKLEEFELSMSDDDLLKLSKSWKGVSNTKTDYSLRVDINDSYWKGKPSVLRDWWGDSRPLADNLVFESLETFLPEATKKNPEPIVSSGESEEGEKLAETVRKHLIYQTDRLKLKQKIKKGTRNWAIRLVGVWKVGWDEIEDDIDVITINPRKLILDPNAYIDEGGVYHGEFIGEHKTATANQLLIRFPKKKEEILKLVQEKKGTKLGYIEWWTKGYVFFTMQSTVLAKYQNPHWNYGGKEEIVDEFGVKMEHEAEGNNHFAEPRMPYVFMTVFDTQEHPWDETSLIEQVQRLQDTVNKRIRQLDKNADIMNGGLRVSGDHFTQSEAGLVAQAEMDGDPIWVPEGDVNTAVSRIQSPGLPSDVHNSMVDARGEIRGIFGTTALTAQGIASTETARGKIMARTADGSRIGGGITETIEQVYDALYNWMVQLMYVYYDEEHVASVSGGESGKEYARLRSDQMKHRLIVSVKEGSLIPEDPLTKRNEAMDLWGAGAIDPITLYKRLGDPNPVEAAKKLVQWQTNPMSLFPDLQAEQQQMAPPEQQGQPPQEAPPQPGMQQAGMPPALPSMEAPQAAAQAASLENVPLE